MGAICDTTASFSARSALGVGGFFAVSDAAGAACIIGGTALAPSAFRFSAFSVGSAFSGAASHSVIPITAGGGGIGGSVVILFLAGTYLLKLRPKIEDQVASQLTGRTK